MATIGFHASHEQHAPQDLLRFVQLAEEHGFDNAMCSDHFFPWNLAQDESGHAWTWLGAALQATSCSFGVVNAPGQRYHPAIIAQAAATLGCMFPDRFWMAVGSGQNMNEHITGDKWPPKRARNERLRECVDIMRRLWDGETVSHEGHVTVDEAYLHTRPDSPPSLFGAAITPKTASWVAEWADGLITVGKPIEELKEVVSAFRENGGVDKPMRLQVQLSYADSREEALQAAHEQWRTNVFASRLLSDLRMPNQFEAAAEFVQPEDVVGPVLVSDDLDQHTEWLQEYIDLGFDALYLHDVHLPQEPFIRDFGEHVLPQLRSS